VNARHRLRGRAEVVKSHTAQEITSVIAVAAKKQLSLETRSSVVSTRVKS